MLVDQRTKIAALLRHHPQALETIVSLNPRFERLRNPFLRRLMAGRTSIGMAARIAGCAEEDFYRVLSPLGFKIAGKTSRPAAAGNPMPQLLQLLKEEQLVCLDVRPLLAAGNDPLKDILAKVKAIKAGQALKIINTFEPTPLIGMLKKKGFGSWTNTLGPEWVETWFFTQEAAQEEAFAPQKTSAGDWHQLRELFGARLVEIDVRELEMPQPMHKILASLEQLPQEYALYVVHKRIPVYLLPELHERQFDYRSRQLSENEVHLLIFRNQA